MSTQQMTDSHDIMDGVNPQYIDTHMKSIDHKRNYKNGINKYHFRIIRGGDRKTDEYSPYSPYKYSNTCIY